ncbi:MAG: heavy-metal-associated domain-containing protein [Bacteroidetes bacterium]|nr:heavy-metal-associated domain-containing protein [Bacteroidota bacterium]
MINKLVVCLLLVASTVSFAQKSKQEIRIKTSAQCEMCKKKIEKAVKAVDGVGKATLNLSDKVITVKFNSSKTNADAIRKAINAVGYDADDTKASMEAYDKLPGCCKKN